MRAARAWASLVALSSTLLGPTDSEYVGWTLMDAEQACYRLELIPIEDPDTCFGEAARFVGLNVTVSGYVATFYMGYLGCVYVEASNSLAYYPASLGGDELYEGRNQLICTGMVTTTSMTSDSSTTSITASTSESTTSASSSTSSSTTSTTTTRSTSTTTSTTTYTGEATLWGTVVFEATSSARRLGAASLGAEVVDEAARAALASVLDVGEETISLSSSSSGSVWRVEYALVGTYPEMLVARDATQGMADGNGVLETALDGALGSRSAQLAPGSVLADRGEVLLGIRPVTNTLTSTTTATVYLPSASLLDGEGSLAANTVVVLVLLGALSTGGIALAVCFARLHRKSRAGHQREQEMKGFDSISPQSAWECDGGGAVSGIPPLKEGQRQDLPPGLFPELHVTW